MLSSPKHVKIKRHYILKQAQVKQNMHQNYLK